ncbi:MAG: choice-of-anchor D domain-containing protein [Candidatus Latescibacterota bacterium]
MAIALLWHVGLGAQPPGAAASEGATEGTATLRSVPSPAEGLDLGGVVVGQVGQRVVTVTNLGTQPVTLNSVALTGGDSTFQVGAPQQVRLGPGEMVRLAVRFRPLRDGAHRARLVVLAGTGSARLEIPVVGEGLAASALFSPIPRVGMAFGRLELGQTQTQTLTVLNQGKANLVVQQVEISGGGFSTPWEARSTAPIPPGGQAQIPVVFRPRYEGKASGELVVQSNDAANPTVAFPLTGAAQQSPPAVEVLNQNTVDFGSIPVGKDERDYLLLWNHGGTPFTVTASLAGPARDEFSLELPSVLLQPGEFRKVALRFSPRERGDRQAALLVTTESGEQEIALTGVGRFLELTPTSLEFDQVVVGRSVTMQVEVQNFGNADYTITNVVSGDPKTFAVKSQVSPSNKFALPGQGLRPLLLTVTFSPSARGPYASVLQLQGYWDEAFETREITLSGTGIAADLEIHPGSARDFGRVVLGRDQTQSLVATNTGDTDLEVVGHPESPEAWIEPAQFTLQPGQSTHLEVHFRPQSLGKRTATVRLISNAVKERSLPLRMEGEGELDNVDLARVVCVLVTRKTRFDTLATFWNNTPVVLPDQSKIDLVFQIPEPLRQAMIGRRFYIEWIALDDKYDEQGAPTKLELQIQDAGEERILAEKLNLRLLEKERKRVRLKVSTQNHASAPLYSISQVFEAGGWKWEFEAKPLVSFFSVRPARDWVDDQGVRRLGRTERLIGLPGIAFFGFHNSGNATVSGVHLTAIGNVLEALSTENSIAVSLGVALSFYRDRFMFGVGRDVYDHRPADKRRGTEDYIMTFKYWGLQK